MTHIPTHVTFKGLAHRDDLETDIRTRVAWLGRFYDRLERCRVVVEVPHRHRADGRQFHVRLELTVPGGTPIVVNHEPSIHATLKEAELPAARKDREIGQRQRRPHVAIHDAFDAARRRLEDFAREQRHAVKTHDQDSTAGSPLM